MCQTPLNTRRRKKKTKQHNMCQTPLNTRRRKTNKNTTQYVLDIAKHKTKKIKQKHNTICVRHR